LPRLRTLLIALPLVLLSVVSAALGAAPQNIGRVRIEYVPPADSAHQPIYDAAKKVRVLEYVKSALIEIRLPRVLWIKLTGCDGEANASYENYVITVCYEYVEEIINHAAEQPPVWSLTQTDSVAGPLMDVFMHEAGHALFDMLSIPVLGREEDAADQFAALTMLQFDKQRARKLILATANQYAIEMMRQLKNNLPGSTFAGTHGHPAQRFFNILCTAYGADSKLFADLVDRGYLPEDRAEECKAEYEQVRNAFAKLVGPFVDKRKEARRLKKKQFRPARERPVRWHEGQ